MLSSGQHNLSLSKCIKTPVEYFHSYINTWVLLSLLSYFLNHICLFSSNNINFWLCVFPCADAPAASKLAFSFAYVLLSSFLMSVCQVIKSLASFKPLSVSFPLELPKPTQSKRSNTCFKCEPDPVNVWKEQKRHLLCPTDTPPTPPSRRPFTVREE